MIEGIAVGLAQALVKKKQTKWSHVKFYKNKVEGTSLIVILKRKNLNLDFFVKKEKNKLYLSFTIEDLNCLPWVLEKAKHRHPIRFLCKVIISVPYCRRWTYVLFSFLRINLHECESEIYCKKGLDKFAYLQNLLNFLSGPSSVSANFNATNFGLWGYDFNFDLWHNDHCQGMQIIASYQEIKINYKSHLNFGLLNFMFFKLKNWSHSSCIDLI